MKGFLHRQHLHLLQELNAQQLKKQKDQQSQLDALTAKLESGQVSHLSLVEICFGCSVKQY